MFAQTGSTQFGVASFYGKKFHGRKTANGERFSMWAMTAAHKTIPFNTKVKVTNLENNKSIVVRINDYGPFSKGRIIDLSRGAAAKIGMIESGTAKVRLDIVGRDGRHDAEKAKGNTEYFKADIVRQNITGYGVQLASFTKMENLIDNLDRFRKKDIGDVFIQLATVNGARVHRIVLGGYDSKEAAEWKLKTLKAKGIDGFVFRIP